MQSIVKVTAIATAVALACAAGTSAATKVTASKVQPIAIDGSIGDWKDVPVQYFDVELSGVAPQGAAKKQ